MSRLNNATTRPVGNHLPHTDEARARQQNRVLAWVVGSAVAMHLLVVVGVLWLAQAQGKAQHPAQTQQMVTGVPTAAQPDTVRGTSAQPETVRNREGAGPSPVGVGRQAAHGQTAHWSASLTKDRPAPWRVDANGHVVAGR